LLSKNLKIKIYRTIILPVVMYGYETWSLTLREERRLRVFENRMLRRIFGPKRDEVTSGWRGSDLYIPLVRPRSRWEDNIKIDLQEVGCGGMNWIELAQNRDRWWEYVNAVMNLRVPQSAGNFLTS
jgi:hypothetical protein